MLTTTMQFNKNLTTVSRIDVAFENAVGTWKGCDWPMEFGPLRLQLQGLKSKQAVLIAKATAGEESSQWKAAAHWLAQVERDANSAEIAAHNALDAAHQSDWAVAKRYAETASSLEAAYPSSPIWREFAKVIAQMANSIA